MYTISDQQHRIDGGRPELARCANFGPRCVGFSLSEASSSCRRCHTPNTTSTPVGLGCVCSIKATTHTHTRSQARCRRDMCRFCVCVWDLHNYTRTKAIQHNALLVFHPAIGYSSHHKANNSTTYNSNRPICGCVWWSLKRRQILPTRVRTRGFTHMPPVGIVIVDNYY